MATTVPTGGYPKMVTGTDASGRAMPLVYPAGHANQFGFVVFNSAADEKAYDSTGVLASTVQGASSSHGNGWGNGNWKK